MTSMAIDSRAKEAKKEILGKHGKAQAVIQQYFQDARTTGDLPTMGNAVTQIDERMQPVYDELAKKYSLSNEERLWVEANCNGEIHENSESAYRWYSDKYHPEITGQAPYHLSEKDKKATLQSIGQMKRYVLACLNTMLNNCMKQGVCPSESQVNSFLAGKEWDAENKYSPKGASSEQARYIGRQLDLYRPSLIEAYKDFAKKVKITNSMPTGSSEPIGAVNGGTGTTSTTDGKTHPSGSLNFLKPKNPVVSDWARTNISFSGCDMVVSANMRSTDGHTVSVVMGTVQTLSYSIYRKLSPINNIGNVNAKDYVGGPRTVAGSLVFTVMHQHWAAELLDKFYEVEKYARTKKVLMDEVAPIDLTVTMANEFGVNSRLAIYGVRLFSEGQVMSINDIYTENTYQYVALNVDYLANIDLMDDPWTEYNQQSDEYHRAQKEAEAAAKVPPASDGTTRSEQPTSSEDEPPAAEEKQEEASGATEESSGRESIGPAPEGKPSTPGNEPTVEAGVHVEDSDVINYNGGLINAFEFVMYVNGKTVGECKKEAEELANKSSWDWQRKHTELRKLTVRFQNLAAKGVKK